MSALPVPAAMEQGKVCEGVDVSPTCVSSHGAGLSLLHVGDQRLQFHEGQHPVHAHAAGVGRLDQLGHVVYPLFLPCSQQHSVQVQSQLSGNRKCVSF